jgi:hypothetical protein
MGQFILTVRLPKSAKHDPQNKKTGSCPLSIECTDLTGEHHSTLITLTEDISADELLDRYRRYQPDLHVTRIEKV